MMGHDIEAYRNANKKNFIIHMRIGVWTNATEFYKALNSIEANGNCSGKDITKELKFKDILNAKNKIINNSKIEVNLQKKVLEFLNIILDVLKRERRTKVYIHFE